MSAAAGLTKNTRPVVPSIGVGVGVGVGGGVGVGVAAPLPTSVMFRSTAALPPGVAVKPKVVEPPAASEPFQLSLRTV